MAADPKPLKLWDRDKGKAVEEFMPDRGGSVCLNSELGLDEWVSCRVQAATGCGSVSK